jgi:hypothetical protein
MARAILYSLQLVMYSCHVYITQWDVLVKGGVVREEVHVTSSAEADDAVSILHVKVPNTSSFSISRIHRFL